MIGSAGRLSAPAQVLSAQPPRLLDRVRGAIRARHYSLRTEEAYVAWIRRFILFHKKRHPAEINQFLTHLAVAGNVSASTQNQALSAILFLYEAVLETDLDRIEGVVRSKKPRRLPEVLTREEVRASLDKMSGTPKLVALLLYGAGLRLLEALRLRVKDIDNCLAGLEGAVGQAGSPKRQRGFGGLRSPHGQFPRWRFGLPRWFDLHVKCPRPR